MSETVTVKTPSGTFLGETGYHFLGVPYASAKRFRAPELLTFSEPVECLSCGPCSPQGNYRGVKPEGLEYRMRGSEEDCLNLNIWTPTLDTEAKLPVCLYIHGGAFQFGSNAESGDAGDRFIGKTGMVFVSANYRLGALGFLELRQELGEDYAGSGVNGALDVLAALTWIRNNISCFGGDPSRVTVMGISAGAKILGALLAMPRAFGLFDRMVLESGATQALRTRETAAKLTSRFLAHAGISAKDLLTMPASDLIRLQLDFCETPGSTCFFGPVIDGDVFPENWQELYQNGRGYQGSLLLGSGRNELVMMTESAGFAEIRDTALHNLFGVQDEAAKAAFAALCEKGMEERAAWTKVCSDFMYRSYTDRLAARMTACGNTVYNYSFEYGIACHGMGFAFLMNKQAEKGPNTPLETVEDAQALSLIMRDYIRRYIITGDPNQEVPGTDTPVTETWKTANEAPDGKLFFGENHTPRAQFRVQPDDSIGTFPEYVFRL